MDPRKTVRQLPALLTLLTGLALVACADGTSATGIRTAGLAQASLAVAGDPLFLKIDGVKGESQDDKHPDELVIESYSLGAKTAGTSVGGGGAGAGKVSFQDITFTAPISVASPVLLQAAATGKHFKSAVLVAEKGPGGKYLQVVLTDVVVTSYVSQGSSSDAVPTDTFSLSFSKIEIDVFGKDAKGGSKGAVKGCFDLKASTGC